jgi:hypothetical protein
MTLGFNYFLNEEFLLVFVRARQIPKTVPTYNELIIK